MDIHVHTYMYVHIYEHCCDSTLLSAAAAVACYQCVNPVIYIPVCTYMHFFYIYMYTHMNIFFLSTHIGMGIRRCVWRELLFRDACMRALFVRASIGSAAPPKVSCVHV